MSDERSGEGWLVFAKVVCLAGMLACVAVGITLAIREQGEGHDVKVTIKGEDFSGCGASILRRIADNQTTTAAIVMADVINCYCDNPSTAEGRHRAGRTNTTPREFRSCTVETWKGAYSAFSNTRPWPRHLLLYVQTNLMKMWPDGETRAARVDELTNLAEAGE